MLLAWKILNSCNMWAGVDIRKDLKMYKQNSIPHPTDIFP